MKIQRGEIYGYKHKLYEKKTLEGQKRSRKSFDPSPFPSTTNICFEVPSFALHSPSPTARSSSALPRLFVVTSGFCSGVHTVDWARTRVAGAPPHTFLCSGSGLLSIGSLSINQGGSLMPHPALVSGMPLDTPAFLVLWRTGVHEPW